MIATGTLILGVFGLVQLYGISPANFTRQLFFFIVSFTIFLIVRKLRIDRILSAAVPIFIGSIILLVAILFIGNTVNGARRWIQFEIFSIQPSEFAKLGIILFLAWIAYTQKRLNFRGFMRFLAILCIPIALVFLQPDFGSAMILVTILIAGIIQLQLPKRYYVYLLLISLSLSPLIFVTLKDYQRARLTSFFSSQSVARSSNFNREQSTIAVGSGGVWGKGLGAGKQSRLAFLPEDHTDFAFASHTEQFGLAGAFIIVLGWMSMLLILLNRYTHFVQNPARRTLLYTIFAMFTVQWLVNIGMNIGLLPITGIPLPFVSYGGTSLLVSCITLGIVDNRT